MSDLVGNAKDPFSHIVAHIRYAIHGMFCNTWNVLLLSHSKVLHLPDMCVLFNKYGSVMLYNHMNSINIKRYSSVNSHEHILNAMDMK